MKNKKIKDSVVKISSKILEEVEDFINLPENRYKYVNRKQLINIAVNEYLAKMKKKVGG